jgi:FkbM family methyltransferase
MTETLNMNTIIELFNRLKSRGVDPNAFLDIGAHIGQTNEIIRYFYPNKRVVSFEANPYCEPELKKIATEYFICLLGKESKENVKLFINSNNTISTGMSIYIENSNFFKNTDFLHVPMHRLDEIVSPDSNFDFIKMDVQGAEIDVLEGTTRLIPSIKWIFLEVSFINYNEGAPLFDEVYMYLRNLGYRITDECDPLYINNRLAQTNYLFERP